MTVSHYTKFCPILLFALLVLGENSEEKLQQVPECKVCLELAKNWYNAVEKLNEKGRKPTETQIDEMLEESGNKFLTIENEDGNMSGYRTFQQANDAISELGEEMKV